MITKTTTTVLATIAGLVALDNPALAAGWKTYTQTDKMTDAKTVIATVDNGRAALYIWEDNGNFQVAFELNSRGTIHYQPKEIGLRVDKREAIFLNLNKWTPKRVFFDLNGEQVDELISGKTLLIQYYSDPRMTRTETFSLAGSTKAIRRALPSYRTPSERDSDVAAEKVRATQNANEAERRMAEEALKECPTVWMKVKENEKRTGRPQLWQGCKGAY